MINLLKSILILFLVFVFQTGAYASSTGITVISDAHINSDKQNNKMTSSIKNLLNAVEQANADTSDCVIFLGDNTSSASREDVAMFAKIIKKLKKPYYVVLGNRDVAKSRGVNKKEFYRIVNKYSSNKISNLPCYKRHDDFVFVFMSGVNETFPTYRGYYKKSELDFLDKTLSKFSDKKVIIFQHFPIVPPKEDKERETYKPEMYFDTISKHSNVLAIISGHYHKEGVAEQNSIYHISAPALSSSGEYEQIKIFKNKNGTYTITSGTVSVE